MTRDEWRELVEYGFERYGDAPRSELDVVFELLERLNDDLANLRSDGCIAEVVADLKRGLDRIVRIG
ncbi:hypothetical protein ACCT18_01300 [Rhizobium ruizarguesonis]